MDFAFNASALAAGGVIERGNVITTLSGLGSVVLPSTGGEGRTAVTNYYSEELELAQAETRVSARQFIEKNPKTGKEEARFATWTSVLMKDVRIFNRVQVEEMGMTISSTRGFEDDDDHEFQIRIWFREVRIGRRKLEVGIDEGLMRMGRYDEFQSFLGSKGKAASLAKRHDASPENLANALKQRKPVRVSLVESIKGWETPALATIDVRGLGTFRFGELMLKPGHRRVNLIRASFGPPKNVHKVKAASFAAEEPFVDSPTGGSMVLGTGEGNGTPIEP